MGKLSRARIQQKDEHLWVTTSKFTWQKEAFCEYGEEGEQDRSMLKAGSSLTGPGTRPVFMGSVRYWRLSNRHELNCRNLESTVSFQMGGRWRDREQSILPRGACLDKQAGQDSFILCLEGIKSKS